MKKLNPHSGVGLCLVLLLSLLLGCTDHPFESFEESQKGVFAKQLELTGSFNPADKFGSKINVRVEFHDDDHGRTVDSYDWTVTFISNGGNDGRNVEKTLVRQIPSSLFHENESGLQEVSFSFELWEILYILNMEKSDFREGDIFRFEASIKTKDGLVLDRSNLDPNFVSQPSFNALFFFDVSIDCSLSENSFIGRYKVTILQKEGGFGSPWGGTGNVVSLRYVSPTERSFVTPIEEHGLIGANPIINQILKFNCSEIIVPNTSYGFGCDDSEIVIGQQGTPAGSFDINDDSSFTAQFTQDIFDSCTERVTNVRYLFEKY